MDTVDWEIIQRLSLNESCASIASSLSLSQPAVSYRLKHIEEELGHQIFNRHNKNITLNETGVAIIPSVNRILQNYNAVTKIVKTTSGPLRGEITVGYAFALASYHLPSIIKDFSQLYPDLQISIRVREGETLMKMVADGDLSAALIRGEPQVPLDAGLKAIPLMAEPVYIMSSQPITDDYLCSRSQIKWYTNDGDFSGGGGAFTRSYIKCPISSGFRAQLDKWWNERFPEPPKPLVETDDVAAGINLLLGGVGWTFVSASRIPKNRNKIHLKKLEFKNGEPLLRKTTLISINSVDENDVLKAFINYNVNYFNRISDSLD